MHVFSGCNRRCRILRYLGTCPSACAPRTALATNIVAARCSCVLNASCFMRATNVSGKEWAHRYVQFCATHESNHLSHFFLFPYCITSLKRLLPCFRFPVSYPLFGHCAASEPPRALCPDPPPAPRPPPRPPAPAPARTPSCRPPPRCRCDMRLIEWRKQNLEK